MRIFAKRTFLVCLAAVAIFALANMLIPKSQFAFSPQILEIVAASDQSKSTPTDIAYFCFLGPYQQADFATDVIDVTLVRQLAQTSVDENSVRIATFDSHKTLLHELDIPKKSRRFHTELDETEAMVCSQFSDFAISMTTKDTAETLQISRRRP